MTDNAATARLDEIEVRAAIARVKPSWSLPGSAKSDWAANLAWLLDEDVPWLVAALREAYRCNDAAHAQLAQAENDERAQQTGTAIAELRDKLAVCPPVGDEAKDFVTSAMTFAESCDGEISHLRVEIARIEGALAVALREASNARRECERLQEEVAEWREWSNEVASLLPERYASWRPN